MKNLSKCIPSCFFKNRRHGGRYGNERIISLNCEEKLRTMEMYLEFCKTYFLEYVLEQQFSQDLHSF